jgi:hypothetical protein
MEFLLYRLNKLSRLCGILTILQPYRPPQPVTGIALLYGLNILFRVCYCGNMSRTRITLKEIADFSTIRAHLDEQNIFLHFFTPSRRRVPFQLEKASPGDKLIYLLLYQLNLHGCAFRLLKVKY